MLDNNHIQTRMEIKDEQQDGETIEFTFVVKVRMNKPSQTPRLPDEYEGQVEIAGQQYKRELFKKVIEHADAELVASKAKNENISLYDSKPFTFNTIFGSVPVKRRRVKYENGKTEILSAQAWQNQYARISRGLRAAVCHQVVKTSVEGSRVEVARRTGEKELLSTRTVLNILHEAGDALQRAVADRALVSSLCVLRGSLLFVSCSKLGWCFTRQLVA